jgi:DNA-nicking Smr family endonuclease
VRQLSPDEAALWARVTATIEPLSRQKLEPQAVEKEQQAPQPTAPPKPSRHRPAAPAPPPRPRVGNTLDGSWDKRLRSGAVDADRVLDLHGMNLESAWRAIDRSLEHAISAASACSC